MNNQESNIKPSKKQLSHFVFSESALERVIDAVKKQNNTKTNWDTVRPKFVYDTKEPGLMAYILPTGKTTFFIKHNLGYHNARTKVGNYPATSIDDARQRVRLLKVEIDAGKYDPRRKYEEKPELTFKEAVQLYLEGHAKLHNRKSSLESFERAMRIALPVIGNKKLSEVKQSDVHALHTKATPTHGMYAANRVVAYIKTVYNRMIDWGYFAGIPPSRGVKRYKENTRDRFLLKDELPRFLQTLQSYRNPNVRDFFMIALYTGARKSNVCQMRWQDIDFHLKEWRIPDSKNGEPIRVPLIEQAVEILERRKDDVNRSQIYVFPSPRSNSKPIQNYNEAWREIVTKAGLENFRIHDLRRTNGSYQAIAGVSLPIIGKVLGHKSLKSTEIYARLSMNPLHDAVQKAFQNIYISDN